MLEWCREVQEVEKMGSAPKFVIEFVNPDGTYRKPDGTLASIKEEEK
jgi:hypothetical protein